MDKIINEMIADHLTDDLGYDFVHEVIAVYGVSDWQGTFLQTKVEYRGTNGEYGTLTLDSAPEEFFEAFGA